MLPNQQSPRSPHDDRPSLAHFVVFNPTLALAKPKPRLKKDGAIAGADSATATANTPDAPKPPASKEERDRDLEDDLREAAQIVFYTSRESGGVSRDRMLRQVGLAKGLMGFAE